MGERVRSRIGRRKGKEAGSCWREGGGGRERERERERESM